MLNALSSYQFNDNPVRVVMIEGEPWFVANDVSTVLGYSMAPHMTRRLHEDEKGIHLVDTLGGQQSMTIINESGLYNSIFGSKKEEAEQFRRWVTGEVLPELRRTGQYQIKGLPAPAPSADEDIDVARMTAAIGVVREARQVWGPLKTRDIWIKLGLPTPIADAEHELDGDPIIDDLRRAIEGMQSATTDELLDALQVSPADRQSFKLRRRIQEGIRIIGWRGMKERRNGHVVNIWASPERLGRSAQEGR